MKILLKQIVGNNIKTYLNMNTDDLKKFSLMKKYIKGIYNYCDKWCEKCPFTSRCLHYIISTNPGVCEFDSTKMIREPYIYEDIPVGGILRSETACLGIPLYKPLDKATLKIVREANRLVSVKLAYKYISVADNLFDKIDDIVKDSFISNKKYFQEIRSASEVLTAYHFEIYSKLLRASTSQLTKKKLIFEQYSYFNEANGSAKAALIFVNRSITAWKKLLFHFLFLNKKMNKVVLLLEKIYSNIENDFPGAKNFKHNWFDE